jgi:hypothetical protein
MGVMMLLLDISFLKGTGYEYDGYVFVAWVLPVRRAEVVTNDQPVSGHFSSNAVTLSSVLPRIILTRKSRISSDGSCISIVKVPISVQPSASVYCGHSIVD